jgi:UDP-N-acetylmuramate--alanine ligase
MHIFFSGIGGTGIGPLALIAKQAGHSVSGSDKQDSAYIANLRKHGITDIHIGQDRDQIASVHTKQPIDWYVYSSAVSIEQPDAPEFVFCREQDIKMSTRDGLLNFIITDKKLQLIAVAGTHGKTTTTAMAVWAFKELGIPLSYSVGAKINFGPMGQFTEGGKYFVYECDEFARNFLAFEPALSLITGVSWDHHEVFPTREDYQAAFTEFIGQSAHSLLWQEDADYLQLPPGGSQTVLDSAEPNIDSLTLAGRYNRLDAWLVVQAVYRLTHEPIDKLVQILNKFPGLQRRMEQIVPNLYSDYAHTPEKIRGGMSVATEMAAKKGQQVVIVYEPLTNRRQHFMKDEYQDCFEGANHVYWIPSYLAREDPGQAVLTPTELITHLSDPSIASPMERNNELKHTIQKHLDAGDLVVAMAGGGGDSLDEWLRAEFRV